MSDWQTAFRRLNAHLGCPVDIFPPENTIVQSYSCVVIDELQDLQTCHLCSVQDRPALGLVKKGWDRDDCIFDRLFC